MLKVIIADDEKKICNLLKNIVDWESLGFEIVTMVNNGQQLKEKVMELRPDLVITDIQMPGCSGLEFLEYIREQKLDLEVLIISGYRDFEYVRQALRNGAADYLLKPLGKEALENALKKILEKHNIVLEAKAKMEQMSDSLSKISKLAGKNLIYDILENRIDQISKEKINEDYRCGFEKENLYALVVKIDMKDKTLRDFERGGIGNKFTGIIENAILSAGSRMAYGIKSNYFYILTDSDSYEAIERSAYHIIYDIRDYLVNMNSGHVSVGLSLVEDGKVGEAVGNSFIAAWESLFKGTEKVLTYKKAGDEKAAELKRAALHLSNAFLGRSIEVFNEEISRAFTELEQQTQDIRSGYAVYKYILNIQDDIAKTCHQILAEEDEKEVYEIIRQYYEGMSSGYRMNVFEKMLLDEGAEIIDLLDEKLNAREKLPVRRVKELIEKRYDEDLSLQDIADELNMASSYVSKLIKKEMNVNFTQYLNSVRLEKAKELLEKTDKTVAEIAGLTGYRDEKYFMRIFKKEIGITTKEYRRLYGS